MADTIADDIHADVRIISGILAVSPVGCAARSVVAMATLRAARKAGLVVALCTVSCPRDHHSAYHHRSRTHCAETALQQGSE
jgi:hypothetical protein